MIARYLPSIIAAVALGLCVWWVMTLRSQNAALTRDNAALTRELQAVEAVAEQAQLARAVEAAHRKREAARAAEKERALEALVKGDFTDADTAIDPRIADFLDCLRRDASRNENDCAAGLGGPADARPDQ
ncbi:hypothetical protein [Roseovarius mucosus]|uniref:hypothetical protein n=1 Tax=Roseovarius mucosus TaxID=215743 RepID=UPI0035D0CEFE